MCRECRSYRCVPGCPNFEMPSAIFTCKKCKDPIYTGDEYVDVEENQYHRECFEMLDIEIILSYIGGELKIAESYDGSDDAYDAYRD